MTRLNHTIRFLALLLLASTLPGCNRQSAVHAAAQPQQNDTAPRPTSTPYSGDLSIFETPGRDQRLHIDRVMDLLHITPGKSVADIGAGGGWFTVRAARRVGPGGVVYAEEISAPAVDAISQRAAREHLGNIRTVLGSPNDPRLPDNSVDAVLMLKMYHEIARPSELLRHLRPALRPGALLGIIDKNGNGSGTDHGLPEATLVRELEAAGFAETARYDFVKSDGEDYFLLFKEKEGTK